MTIITPGYLFRNELIAKGKKVIQQREDFGLYFSSDFNEGFREGVAEIIAALTGEAAADVLEEITPE